MTDDGAAHAPRHGPLVPLAPDLWQVTAALGPLPRAMVVHRLPSGGLWLHSVVALDAPGRTALDALGPVEAIVVPNAFHRLDCGGYAARYPSARVYAPAAARAAVATKCRVDETCEDGLPRLGIAALTPRGTRPGELAYALRLADGGAALVVADLLFNVRDAPGGVSGFILKHVTDSVGPLKISRVFRLLALKDRVAYADWVASLAEIPDLRALSVAHGDPVTDDVAGALRAAATRIRGS